MINLCFLQFIAVAKAQSWRPLPGKIGRDSSPPSQKQVHWAALVIAAALHLAWFALLASGKTEKTVTPAPVIMVNWVAASTVKTLAPQAPAQKITPKTEKPKSKTSKRPALITTPSEAVAPTAEQHASMPPSLAVTSSSAVEATQAPLILPNLNADYLNNPAPVYPSLSRRLGEQGKVLLRVWVNADGQVEQVDLRQSSGYARLDSIASDTVKQWRFVPARRGQQAVAAWVVVPILFSLEG